MQGINRIKTQNRGISALTGFLVCAAAAFLFPGGRGVSACLAGGNGKITARFETGARPFYIVPIIQAW